MTSALDRLATAPSPGVEELQAISVFSDLEPHGLAWLASQMAVVDIGRDEIAIREGDPADYLFVILQGELRAERKDGGVWFARAGQVTGMLPYSRLTHFPGTVRAAVQTRVASLRKERFPEMLQRMPVLQPRLVSVLAD